METKNTGNDTPTQKTVWADGVEKDIEECNIKDSIVERNKEISSHCHDELNSDLNDTLAIINAMDEKPNEAQKDLIYRAVKDLKSCGAWSKIDILK